MRSRIAGACFKALVLAMVAVVRADAAPAGADQRVTIPSGAAATATPDAAELRRSLAEADIRSIASKTGWRYEHGVAQPYAFVDIAIPDRRPDLSLMCAGEGGGHRA